MRILDSLAIGYEVYSYPVDEAHLDAVHVARLLDVEPEQVCKTIVTSNESRNIFVFCLPGPFDVNLKKAKLITNSHEIDLVKSDSLRSLTGYIRGGCSPLGMMKNYPLFVEETVQLLPRIFISAGLRGLQICLKPEDLMAVTQSSYADFT